MAIELPGYQITRQIGVGAASTIYVAHELASGKRFAVKHVIRNGPEDDRFIEQAETEYAVSSKIKHPHVRHSHAIHRNRKGFKIKDVLVVMDYVEGLTLEKARPNRLTTFLLIFDKVAAGLHAIHQAGFVHTDIKPINLMIGPRGVVKIIDFGQACPVHHKKERIQGTPDYIAPEQVRRMPLDQRTDVFNLGATMYWVLLSENYPTAIRAADLRGGINLIQESKPIAPIELNDKIPLSLSQLVMDCCRDNPKERPSDMTQVASRLAVVKKQWKKYMNDLRAERRAEAEPGYDSPDQPSGASG
ncbi:MAG: serine/threonine protein kinase [Planctomycetes bacterium]|nr:serine/threonine protein kinase [Planctomycetota bacterium]